MWRLMFTMLAVSNNGGVAVVADHTDWPTEQACRYAARELYGTPPTITVGGALVTINSKAICVPVDQPPPPVEVSRRPLPTPPEVFGQFLRLGPRY